MFGTLAQILTALATVAAAIAGPVVTGILQNRRDNHLRASIAQNLELKEKLKLEESLGLKAKGIALERLVKKQVAALMTREERKLRRKFDWFSLGVALFLGIPTAIILLAMWPPNAWWTWSIFVVLALFLSVVLIGGIGATLNPKEADATDIDDPQPVPSPST